MKRIIKIVAISLLLLLLGCTNDLFTEQTVNERPTQKEDKVGAAIDFLNESFVDKEVEGAASGNAVAPKTVNLSKASIDTIYHLPDENNKPFLQLVVFKPKAYAVISVIKNVPNPPVLFYGQGKFDLKNPGPGLVTFLWEFWLKSVRGKDAAPASPADEDTYDPIISSTVLSKTPTILNQKGPYLKTNWHQFIPFNNTIEKNKGNFFPVGCVGVAVGQIMAYHKKSSLKTYNWNLILKSDDASVKSNGGAADFLWDVAEGVRTNYSFAGSYSDALYAISYLNKSGYGTVSSLLKFDYDKTKRELDFGRPVYVRAYGKKTAIPNNGCWYDLLGNIYRRYKYEEGHAWVADGYKKVKYTIKKRGYTRKGLYVYFTEYDTINYIHMNWGWGGSQSKEWCSYNYQYDQWNPRRPNHKYRFIKQMVTVKP